MRLITLQGQLEHITFQNRETLFTIAKVRIKESASLVTVIGNLGDAAPGELLKISGAWETHPRYGQQFKAHSHEVILPANVNGIRRYLASGVVRGIGAATAEKLVEMFGAQTLQVIEHDPERLLEVEGIGPSKAGLIRRSFQDHQAARDLMRFLAEHGIKSSHAAPLLKLYGPEAIEILKADPYRLVEDFPGAGFQIAETLSRSLGTPLDGAERLKACLQHLLMQAAAEGHVYAHAQQLLERCDRLMEVTAEEFQAALEAQAHGRFLVVEAEDPETRVYLPSLHEAETGLSNRLKALLSIPLSRSRPQSRQLQEIVADKLAIALSPEQLDVLEHIFHLRAAVVTGGPGTGKTTLIRALCAVFASLFQTIHLAAPTGRAARRLTEVAGREAKTIHRLLGYNFRDGYFEKNSDNPLEAGVVIVDEASMVDIALMHHLATAIPLTSVLILVGDAFQLPSVGPGNVLADLIQSEILPVFSLSTIFRQEEQSPIVLGAHQIRQGEFPDLALARPDPPPAFDPPFREALPAETDLPEFCFLEAPSPGRAAQMVVNLCRDILPARFGYDPIRDIQVLTPMHKGETGTLELNQRLQRVLNAGGAALESLGTAFRAGDKVMHLVNNYLKDVFNGDIGTITTVDREAHSLVVDYFDRPVIYTFDELRELVLAYAISVHKSQGSEYPAVVMPFLTQHYMLLQRNLLYTAVTRARERVVIVGSPKALAMAIENDRVAARQSHLKERLKEIPAC